MLADREIQLVQTFVVPSKRERHTFFLSSPKRRSKFLRELYHFNDFDHACVIKLSGPTGCASGLVKELRRLGAPDRCYLISVDRELDGRTLSLEQAIDDIFASVEGTIVCCVPGKLAYYEGEAPLNRFILKSLKT